MEKNLAAEMHLVTVKQQAAIIESLVARLSTIATMAENGEHGIAALAREGAAPVAPPLAPSGAVGLPVLPEPEYDYYDIKGFDEGQMHAYGLACIAAQPLAASAVREGPPKIDENALNAAGWEFIENAPEGTISAHLWNNLKAALRPAIQLYLQKAAPSQQPAASPTEAK